MMALTKAMAMDYIREGIRVRLMDSVETALRWSEEEIEVQKAAA